MIIQSVSIFTTLHLCTYYFFVFYFCLHTLQGYFGWFKPCQTILTRSVRSSSYKFKPYGSDFTTFFLLNCKSRRCQFGPSKIILKLSFLVKRQTFLCMLLVTQVPICVNFHKECTIYGFKYKVTEAQQRWYCIDTGPRFWGWLLTVTSLIPMFMKTCT